MIGRNTELVNSLLMSESEISEEDNRTSPVLKAYVDRVKEKIEKQQQIQEVNENINVQSY